MKLLILEGVNPNHFPEITPISNHQYSIVLAPDTQYDFQIPNDARYVIFNSDQDFYVAYDAMPVEIPSDTPGASVTTTEYNPGQRFIGDKLSISFKSKYLAHIHLSFYA